MSMFPWLSPVLCLIIKQHFYSFIMSLQPWITISFNFLNHRLCPACCTTVLCVALSVRMGLLLCGSFLVSTRQHTFPSPLSHQLPTTAPSAVNDFKSSTVVSDHHLQHNKVGWKHCQVYLSASIRRTGHATASPLALLYKSRYHSEIFPHIIYMFWKVSKNLNSQFVWKMSMHSRISNISTLHTSLYNITAQKLSSSIYKVSTWFIWSLHKRNINTGDTEHFILLTQLLYNLTAFQQSVLSLLIVYI